VGPVFELTYSDMVGTLLSASFAAGVGIKIVQDMLGHSSRTITAHAKGSRSLNQALPPIGAAGRCGRIDESVGKEFPQRLGDPVAVEATAGILRGTSRSGRSSPPSRSLRYRTGRHSHRGARLIGASSACPPPRCGHLVESCLLGRSSRRFASWGKPAVTGGRRRTMNASGAAPRGRQAQAGRRASGGSRRSGSSS